MVMLQLLINSPNPTLARFGSPAPCDNPLSSGSLLGSRSATSNPGGKILSQVLRTCGSWPYVGFQPGQ